jgi:6-phosphogluconolactonase
MRGCVSGGGALRRAEVKMPNDAEPPATELIVGTYAKAGGKGLVRLAVRGDRLIVGEVASDIADMSFALWSARHQRFYGVEEQSKGSVVALAMLGEELRVVSTAGTDGAAPCHPALDPEQSLLAVANYESGSVALFLLGPGGSLPASPTAQVQLRGQGPDRERQKAPHAHWVGFDSTGQRLYVVDLGSDHVWRFDVADLLAGAGQPAVAYPAPAGTGPRHLTFDPANARAFLVSELASTVTSLSVGPDGTLQCVGIVSTLPADAGESGAGAIVLNATGDRLYVTNRGHDSVAVFAVAGFDLTAIQHVASGGASPRHLLLLEDQRKLLVAHEQSGGVRLFDIGDDGRLTGLDIADIPGAAFAAPLPA